MPKDYPDHHDAELVLRLYELRREAVMRESRKMITTQFLPRSYDELMAVTRFEHPMNAAFRQTTSYWEMAFGMARHGIIHADYLAEHTGEGLLLFAKVHPYLGAYRKDVSPRGFLGAEWVATQCEMGRTIFAAMQARVKKQTEAR